MNAKRLLTALTLFVLAAAKPCFALVEIADVTPKEAREMGINVSSHPNGEAGTAVVIEFKPQGKLQHFSHLNLTVHDSAKKPAVDVLIQTERQADGAITGRFSTDPAYLSTSDLTVTVHEGDRTNIGYRIQVKDFITGEAGSKKSAEAPAAIYDKSDMVAAMPTIKATVEHKETYFARLKADDGRTVIIGSDKGDQEVWHFVATALKQGQTYELPKAFHEFQKREFYETVDEIKGMPERKATLELRAPCYSIFRKADGKQFVIGSPGSGDEVWRFLGTLEEGKTYELPKAFLEHLAKPKKSPEQE